MAACMKAPTALLSATPLNFLYIGTLLFLAFNHSPTVAQSPPPAEAPSSPPPPVTVQSCDDLLSYTQSTCTSFNYFAYNSTDSTAASCCGAVIVANQELCLCAYSLNDTNNLNIDGSDISLTVAQIEQLAGVCGLTTSQLSFAGNESCSNYGVSPPGSPSPPETTPSEPSDNIERLSPGGLPSSPPPPSTANGAANRFTSSLVPHSILSATIFVVLTSLYQAY